MAAYYNEIDLYAAEWLRNLIKAGHIADGEVDTRSIIDVSPDDIRRFDQCHFFAGIAGWSHALRLAGWADDRKIWTGSCPCQPFSVAGKGKGIDDERHLWPHFFRLIRSCRPPVIMGEQVAGAAGYGWLDGVRSDLESEGYACEGVDIPACAANAPHIRQRLYWVAKDMVNPDCCWGEGHILHHPTKYWPNTRDEFGDGSGDSRIDNMADAESIRRGGWTDNEDGWWRQLASPDSCARSDMANASISGWRQGIKNAGRVFEGNRTEGEAGRFTKHGDTFDMANGTSERLEGATRPGLQGQCDGSSSNSYWDNAIWLNGADAKARRAQPGVRLLAHGVPARVGKLRAYGNAIVPQIAAEVIKSFMETKIG